MNNLVTDINGGFPLLLNDFRFNDNAVRLALADIVSSVAGTNPIILFGCQTQQQTNFVSVSEGAIFWQGEIWHVYPHNFTAPNPMTEAPYWNFVTEKGIEGSRTFENAETHQVHQIRKAVGTMNPFTGSVGSVSFEGMKRLQNYLIEEVEVPRELGVELVNNATKTYLIKQGRLVSLDFSVSFPGSETMSAKLVGTIPEKYRPADYNTGIAIGKHNGADSVMRYSIDKQTGQILVMPIDGSTGGNQMIILKITYIV